MREWTPRSDRASRIVDTDNLIYPRHFYTLLDGRGIDGHMEAASAEWLPGTEQWPIPDATKAQSFGEDL